MDQSWFLMTSSYSHRFCLGITQCGTLFAICLTDHGGNYTTLDLDVTKQDCTDLSATDKVLDGFKQKHQENIPDLYSCYSCYSCHFFIVLHIVSPN